MPRRRRKPDLHDNPERWLLTYADLITLLLAFFIIMYSMSRLDAKKFGKMADALNGILRGGQTVSPTPASAQGAGMLRLGELKMLRRNAEPDAAMLAELWSTAVAKLSCTTCGQQGLTTSAVDLEGAGWGEATCCEGCGQPIPTERLEALPTTTLCATCQSLDERGQLTPVDIDYCPHCGSIMEVRTSTRGGMTGYVRFCPNCRRQK